MIKVTFNNPTLICSWIFKRVSWFISRSWVSKSRLHGKVLSIFTLLQAFFLLKYVYGDFIEQQFVGNSRAPMLNTFPLFNPQHMPRRDVGDKLGGVLGYSACSSLSQKLSSKTFPELTLIDLLIELRTDTGNLVPFVDVGRTTVTLLFRKKV